MRITSTIIISSLTYTQLQKLLAILASAKPSHHFASRGRIRITMLHIHAFNRRLENATSALYDSGLAW
jgi:hypothetical protein